MWYALVLGKQILFRSSVMARKICILFAVLVLICRFGHVQPETFSSATSLHNFIKGEKLVLSTLDEYIQREVERIERLKRSAQLIRRYSNQYGQHEDQYDEMAGHPINAYHVIKKWHGITVDLQAKSAANMHDFMSRLNEAGLPFPGEHDLESTLASVIRLQHIYKLTVDGLARGEVKGHQAKFQFDVDDYYRLGVSALKNNYAGIAAQWLQGAVKGHSESSSFPLTDALTQLSSAYTMVGRPYDAERISEMALELDGRNCSSTKESNIVLIKCLQKNREEFYVPNFELAEHEHVESDNMKNYAVLCRGDPIVPEGSELKSHLYCKYSPGAVPYFRYKKEIHSLDPQIVFYHDVLSEGEATMVKNFAEPQLARAMVQDHDIGSKVSDDRVGQVTWLWDEDPFRVDQALEIKRLTERIGVITGLNTEHRARLSSSEALQVVNYGIGGQYNPHHDYFVNPLWLENLPDNLMHTGDRIATFMIYLSEPVAGGATVFPQLGVRVPAIKNGAAFWYNMKRSGENDVRTEHAGCPVLLGQKWVANKWIREFGQEFRRRCGLKKEDTDFT